MIKNYLLLAVGLFVFVLVGPVMIWYNYYFFFALLVGLGGFILCLYGLTGIVNEYDKKQNGFNKICYGCLDKYRVDEDIELFLCPKCKEKK